jgi:hypothetical protein
MTGQQKDTIMSDDQTVLIVGLGELGGLVLELLARSPVYRGRIVGADINADAGLRKVNSAVHGALCWGLDPKIDFRPCNLGDVDATAELIAIEKPTLVFNATTLASWWLRDLLPDDVKARLHAVGAGSGLWAPGHAALAYNLMRAVRASGLSPRVVNSAYPDGVNPALARAGLAPIAGIGNGDLLIAPIEQLVARRLHVSPRRLSVRVVAHHFHAYNVLMHGDTRGHDFFVSVGLDGQDVTSELDIPGLLRSVPDEARIPGASGATWIVAASAVRTLTALLTGSRDVLHVPGPDGLVGGYPVTFEPSPTLALPRGIDRERAIAINMDGQRAEGIQNFTDDGTMILTDVARSTLIDVFDMRCERYPLADTLAIAREMSQRLRTLGERYGLTLKVH